MKKKVLIIGGGMAGCASAYVLNKNKDLDVHLVEKNPFLGAGVRTFFYGGHPYTFGPRHFLTFNKEIYKFLNSYVPLRSCSEHQFLSYVEKDKNFYNYPLNYENIKNMPDKKKVYKELKNKSLSKIANAQNMEEYWINSVGKTLYSKVIDKYNKKMWMVNSNRKIDTFKWSPKGATLKKSNNKAAWSEAISCYPIKLNGYNDFFDNVKKLNTRIYLNSVVKKISVKNKIFKINNKTIKFDIVISTISPHLLLGNKFGTLPFIGRDIFKIVIPKEHVFPKNVYFLYYPNDEKFTRLVEYKKFTKYKSKSSLIGMEIPSTNGMHYPVPFKKEIKKSHKYFKSFPDWYFTIGRAGTYRYEVDIDDCIEQALEVGKIINNGHYDGSLTNKKWWKL